MKNLSFIFFLFTCCCFSQSQRMLAAQFPAERPTLERNVIIEGTPYLEADFKSGTALIQNKKSFIAPMRFNAEKEVIEFLGEDGIKRELLRRPYLTAKIGNNKFLITDYLDDKIEKLGYFNAQSGGKTQLLIRPRKTAISTPRYSAIDFTFKYVDVSTYYIKKESKAAEKIKLNSRDLLKHLDDKATHLTRFISKNALNLKKERDVIRLLDYYNALKENENPVKGFAALGS